MIETNAEEPVRRRSTQCPLTPPNEVTVDPLQMMYFNGMERKTDAPPMGTGRKAACPSTSHHLRRLHVPPSNIALCKIFDAPPLPLPAESLLRRASALHGKS